MRCSEQYRKSNDCSQIYLLSLKGLSAKYATEFYIQHSDLQFLV